MRIAHVCLLAAAIGAAVHAGRDMVPAARRVSWNPGIAGGIPAVPTAVSVLDFGASGDGVTDDAAAIQKAIAAVTAPGAVGIPPGTYLLRSPLVMRSGVVLRGAGPTDTHLLINHDGAAVDFRTFQRGAWVAVADGATRGSRVLTVADASRFVAGGYGEIQQDNDAAVMYQARLERVLGAERGGAGLPCDGGQREPDHPGVTAQHRFRSTPAPDGAAAGPADERRTRESPPQTGRHERHPHGVDAERRERVGAPRSE